MDSVSFPVRLINDLAPGRQILQPGEMFHLIVRQGVNFLQLCPWEDPSASTKIPLPSKWAEMVNNTDQFTVDRLVLQIEPPYEVETVVMHINYEIKRMKHPQDILQSPNQQQQDGPMRKKAYNMRGK